MIRSGAHQRIPETTVFARRYLEAAWNRTEPAIEELTEPDLCFFYPLMPAVVRGREAVVQVLRGIRAGLPDLQMAFRPIATQTTTAVFGWTAHATHTGELFGLPPTRREVCWTGVSVVEFMDGRVAEEWGEEDALGLLRQLGGAPAAAT